MIFIGIILLSSIIILVLIIRRLPRAKELSSSLSAVAPAVVQEKVTSDQEELIEIEREDKKDQQGDQEALDPFAEADFYFKNKDFKKTEEKLVEIITGGPKNSKAYNLLGIVYLESENYADAKETFSHALEFDQDNDFIYNNLGLAYYHQGRYDEAIEAYKKSIMLNNLMPHRYINLGLAYMAKRQPDLAEEYFRKALALDPENENYKKLLSETQTKLN